MNLKNLEVEESGILTKQMFIISVEYSTIVATFGSGDPGMNPDEVR